MRASLYLKLAIPLPRNSHLAQLPLPPQLDRHFRLAH
jgi:hypothetical protein